MNSRMIVGIDGGCRDWIPTSGAGLKLQNEEESETWIFSYKVPCQ